MFQDIISVLVLGKMVWAPRDKGSLTLVGEISK